MTEVPSIELGLLLAPIPGNDRTGESLFFSDLQNLRQMGPDQGDLLPREHWEPKQHKHVDWTNIRNEAAKALINRGKDLDVLCIFVEALGHTNGVSGFAIGLDALRQMLERYWPDLHPLPKETGNEKKPLRYDERLNTLSAFAARSSAWLSVQPLVDGSNKSYNFFLWQGARKLDELASSDSGMIEAELKRGKITLEMWRDAEQATADAAIVQRVADLRATRASFDDFRKSVAYHFKDPLPDLKPLDETLAGCLDIMEELRASRGIVGSETPVGEASPSGELVAQGAQATAAAASPGERENALRQISEIAAFFRRTERHSPVSYHLERAIEMANMALPMLLDEVLKNDPSNDLIRERLGIVEKQKDLKSNQ